MDKLSEFKSKYEQFVARNPILVGQAETVFRTLSLLVRGDGSKVKILISELFSSASSLLTLLNDCILRQTYNLTPITNCSSSKIALYLTVIEYVQVVVELSVQVSLGSGLKWFLVVLLQFFKTGLRLLLLFKSNIGLLCVPPVPPLKRQEDLRNQNNNEKPTTFKLERSKRRMRTLENSPEIGQRTFSLGNCKEQIVPTKLTGKAKLAEAIYISRNFVHLLSLGKYGTRSWKPWLLALTMDISHIYLLGDPKKFSVEEQKEIRRRTFLMLLYLFRSPFYDSLTKLRIFVILEALRSNIPLSGLVLTPLIEFLPVWQNLYNYVWTN